MPTEVIMYKTAGSIYQIGMTCVAGKMRSRVTQKQEPINGLINQSDLPGML
jgi:hypothetical protein